ncbi:hypothetical protein BGZ54_010498 [Gamsiella multidivaricata]|nr:hypothetical protein BGZ54_010498 [Gamsiella multidivaricata]
MSPVSRQAKLNNLLGYVDRQRELLSSEEETEDVADRMAGIGNTQYQPVKASSTPQKLFKHTGKQFSEPIVSPSLNTFAQQQVSPVCPPRRQERNHGLDPSMALPRALPRNMTSHRYDLSLYRDSAADDFDALGSPNGYSPDYDFAPYQGWRQGGDRSAARRSFTMVKPARYNIYEDFEAQRRPLVRQLSGSSSEKVKKLGRLGAFLTKGRRTNLRRNGSLNAPTTRSEESGSTESRDRAFQSLSYRTGRAFGTAALRTDSSDSHSDDIKLRSSVKQMLRDVFKKSNKPSHETAEISMEDGLLEELSFKAQEQKLFTLWPQVELDQDSSSSDQSPYTAHNPWAPEPAPLSKIHRSASFNHILKFDFDNDDDEEESQATLQSANLVPIAALIQELSMFGLDYVKPNHVAAA